MNWRIDIPMVVGGRPWTLNDRVTIRQRMTYTKTIRDTVAWIAKSLKIPACQHISVSLHYRPGRTGRHDPMNLIATLKPAVDGLVIAKIVEDDNPTYVTEQVPVIHPGKAHRALWLEIERVELA